jgi:hypothetical protein
MNVCILNTIEYYLHSKLNYYTNTMWKDNAVFYKKALQLDLTKNK